MCCANQCFMHFSYFSSQYDWMLLPWGRTSWREKYAGVISACRDVYSVGIGMLSADASGEFAVALSWVFKEAWHNQTKNYLLRICIRIEPFQWDQMDFANVAFASATVTAFIDFSIRVIWVSTKTSKQFSQKYLEIWLTFSLTDLVVGQWWSGEA